MITKSNIGIRVMLAMVLAIGVVMPVTSQAATLPAVSAVKVTGSLTATSASCTATACVAVPLNATIASVAWQITGTFTGTITFEGTVDGTTYVTVAVVPVGTTRTLVGTATAAGVWQENVSGLTKVRARCSAYTSGTIVVTAITGAGTPPAA